MNGVVYCRVSSKEQTEETGLESQEQACREYASAKDITIRKIFVEPGESAKFAEPSPYLTQTASISVLASRILASHTWADGSHRGGRARVCKNMARRIQGDASPSRRASLRLAPSGALRSTCQSLAGNRSSLVGSQPCLSNTR